MLVSGKNERKRGKIGGKKGGKCGVLFFLSQLFPKGDGKLAPQYIFKVMLFTDRSIKMD